MEKIEEDNRRQREAERLRELAEKEAADTEHRATLASHARRARMEHVNAANERALQEEVSMHMHCIARTCIAFANAPHLIALCLLTRSLAPPFRPLAANAGMAGDDEVEEERGRGGGST